MHQSRSVPNPTMVQMTIRKLGMAMINGSIPHRQGSTQIRFRITPTKIAHAVVFVGAIKVKIFADTKLIKKKNFIYLKIEFDDDYYKKKNKN